MKEECWVIWYDGTHHTDTEPGVCASDGNLLAFREKIDAVDYLGQDFGHDQYGPEPCYSVRHATIILSDDCACVGVKHLDEHGRTVKCECCGKAAGG